MGSRSDDKTALSPKLSAFIRSYIDSVELLETLLLLKSDPSRSWTVVETNQVICSSLESVEARLKRLVQTGFATFDAGLDAFRYKPVPAVEGLTEELGIAYRERRLRVIEAIYQGPPTQIEQFAQAFALKKKGGDQ